jgi:sodium transport system permease protein
VRGYLNGYSNQVSQLRLLMRGVDPELTRPINIRITDMSTPESRGGMVLAFLPYFILITVFMGSMHMAIDTTAGERERKSLEPLLINPLPRWQIMAGKLAATTSFALMTLGLGLIAFVYAMGFLPVADMDMALNLDLRVAALAFLLCAPAALLAAALLTILAAFAKSFREAQSYMGLVILVPMIPSFWILIDPTRTETWMTLVPLLSQNVLILELVRGEPVNAMWFALSIASTSLVAVLLAAVAGTLYNRPRLIFTSG